MNASKSRPPREQTPVYRLQELRPGKFQRLLAERPAVIFPVGSLEWHGPHNCIGVDTIKIAALCEEIARESGVILAPELFYGQCETLADRPGTLAGISEDAYFEFVTGILEGFYHLGFRLVFCLSGHYEGTQTRPLRFALEEFQERHPDCQGFLFIEPDFTRYFPATADSPFALPMEPRYYRGDHAGVYETSLMLHYRPELVDANDLPTALQILEKMTVDPVRSSPEFGAHLARIIVDEASTFVREQLERWQAKNLASK